MHCSLSSNEPDQGMGSLQNWLFSLIASFPFRVAPRPFCLVISAKYSAFARGLISRSVIIVSQLHSS